MLTLGLKWHGKNSVRKFQVGRIWLVESHRGHSLSSRADAIPRYQSTLERDSGLTQPLLVFVSIKGKEEKEWLPKSHILWHSAAHSQTSSRQSWRITAPPPLTWTELAFSQKTNVLTSCVSSILEMWARSRLLSASKTGAAANKKARQRERHDACLYQCLNRSCSCRIGEECFFVFFPVWNNNRPDQWCVGTWTEPCT